MKQFHHTGLRCLFQDHLNLNMKAEDFARLCKNSLVLLLGLDLDKIIFLKNFMFLTPDRVLIFLSSFKWPLRNT